MVTFTFILYTMASFYFVLLFPIALVIIMITASITGNPDLDFVLLEEMAVIFYGGFFGFLALNLHSMGVVAWVFLGCLAICIVAKTWSDFGALTRIAFDFHFGYMFRFGLLNFQSYLDHSSKRADKDLAKILNSIGTITLYIALFRMSLLIVYVTLRSLIKKEESEEPCDCSMACFCGGNRNRGVEELEAASARRRSQEENYDAE